MPPLRAPLCARAPQAEIDYFRAVLVKPLARAIAALAVLGGIIGACGTSDEVKSGAGGASGAEGVASHASTTNASVVASTTASTGGLPCSFVVTGIVTDGSAPLSGAIVMQAGGPIGATLSGDDGSFSFTMDDSIPGVPTLVASRLGYRTHGIEFSALPEGPVELALRAVSPPDNEAYVFEDPGTGEPAHDVSTAYCGHCHTTFVKQFQSSAHARAARDRTVQDIYAGVLEATSEADCVSRGGAWKAGHTPGTKLASMRCYGEGGVLPDLNGCGQAGSLACDDPALPEAERATHFGRCADCHAPGIDGKAGGRDLHEATGIAYENGNHCDVCHHVRDVDVTKPPGVAGRLVLQRPSEKVSDTPGAKVIQALFGPLPDVPNEFMGGSYQPMFKTATLCGGCHDQHQEALIPGQSLDAARWPDGLPTHSTYTEWKESSWGTDASPCQLCHMPPDTSGLVSTMDVTTEANASITYGFARSSDSIRQHIFRGPLRGSPRLIDGAVILDLVASADASGIHATVGLTNLGAGHAVPTGEPMRQLLLLVRAEACGQALTAVSGPTLPTTAGAKSIAKAGEKAVVSGATIQWSEASTKAKPGDVVRVSRPTGQFDDYPGIGWFASPSLAAADKGLPRFDPVAEAIVVSVSAGSLTLDRAIAAQPGDMLALGAPAELADGDPARPLAGAPGQVFERLLVDALGQQGVAHYRAVDIVRDNRLLPLTTTKTSHGFALPAGCSKATVTATLVYRPFSWAIATARGFDVEGRDYVIASGWADVALP